VWFDLWRRLAVGVAVWAKSHLQDRIQKTYCTLEEDSRIEYIICVAHWLLKEVPVVKEPSNTQVPRPTSSINIPQSTVIGVGQENFHIARERAREV
jgi:hypothetical protein